MPPDQPTESDSSIIERVTQSARRVQSLPEIGGLPLPLAGLDQEVWRLGRAWLERHGLAGSEGALADSPINLDVYVATDIYSAGGHTALIGDFVEAQRKAGANAKLVLTAGRFTSAEAIPEAIRSRTGMSVDDIHLVRRVTPAERLDDLFRHLLALRPRRLFLFHHAYDPLPVAVAQPEVCAQRILVHHTDATPTLGLCLPGMMIIELNPIAAALARAQNRPADLLLLTCPDPGPRPHGFLQSDGLVTASSGSEHKFTADYFYSYAETVAAVLRGTRGTHVHIGPLSPEKLAPINQALDAAGVDPHRFLHRAEVPSVSRALWELRCDVYIASFPIDGARTMIEVAASGTPYVSHSRRPPGSIAPRVLDLPGARTWRTLDDLVELLRSLTDEPVLQDVSAQIRAGYDRLYHPDVFGNTLDGILNGQGGLHDPDGYARDAAALNSILGSLTRAEIASRLAIADAAAAIKRSAEARAVPVEAVDHRARSEAAATSEQMKSMQKSLRTLTKGIRQRDESATRETAEAAARNRRLQDDLRKLKAKLRRQKRGGLFRRLLAGRG